MAKKSIVSINCEIPGGFSEFVPFESRTSLLDWDIILFSPTITEFTFSYEKYKGKPSLDEDQSFRLKEASEHWRRELSEAYRVGKTIIVFLPKLTEVYTCIGDRSYSETIRKRPMASYNNYKMLPIEEEVINSQGSKMKLTKLGQFLSDYWREFSAHSTYEVLLEGKTGTPIIVTSSGDKTVGSTISNSESGGTFLFLPHLAMWSDNFYEEKEVPREGGDDEEDTVTDIVSTEDGIKFGRSLLNCIIGINRALRTATEVTPRPEWVNSDDFKLPKESECKRELFKVKTQLAELEQKKDSLKGRLATEGLPKRLLFESGKPLESAIIHSLELIGFQAGNYEDDKSEFDAVFVSDEGRFLGEAEGKNNKSVNISKLRQLEMNILEDYEREDVEQMATGVLFGNAHRLIPPEERGDFFTDKCKTAAKRSGTVLVRTIDLFPIVQYLSANEDIEYAKKCREAILSSTGEVAKFPDIPNLEPAEQAVSAEQST